MCAFSHFIGGGERAEEQRTHPHGRSRMGMYHLQFRIATESTAGKVDRFDFLS
jgi:hypothetical protein